MLPPPPTTKLTILFANDALRFLPWVPPPSDEAPLSGVSSRLRPDGGVVESEATDLPRLSLPGEREASRWSSLKLWDVFLDLTGEGCSCGGSLELCTFRSGEVTALCSGERAESFFLEVFLLSLFSRLPDSAPSSTILSAEFFLKCLSGDFLDFLPSLPFFFSVLSVSSILSSSSPSPARRGDVGLIKSAWLCVWLGSKKPLLGIRVTRAEASSSCDTYTTFVFC